MKEDARQMFALAQRNAWDELNSTIRALPPDVIRCSVDEDSEHDCSSTILHVVVSILDLDSQVPLETVQAILEAAESLASTENENGQVPLHLAVQFIPHRTDVIRCLAQAAPWTVRQVDGTQQRPLDIICRKIIMLEEFSKYSHNSAETFLESTQVWETVNVLAQFCSSTLSKRGSPDQQSMLTACLLAEDFPYALGDRALKRYRNQLLEPNVAGDLPLHSVARAPPPPQADGEDDYDDEDSDFLDRVLSLAPQAASRRNRHDQTPLALAIQNGRGWGAGVSQLLAAYPPGLFDLQIPLQLYPKVLERVWKGYDARHSQKEAIIYAILQARPDFLLFHNEEDYDAYDR